MKIYLDLVFFINFFYDSLIIISVSLLLKKHIKLKRVLISSLLGSLSLLTLFFSFNGIILIIFKFLLSLLMVIIAFGFNDLKNNLFYFYIITIILGGTTYLLNGSNLEINIFLMFFLGPIIIYLYIKSNNQLKLELSTIYDVIIIDKENTYKVRGIMDTGNNIKCPITNLPVILINDSLKISKEKLFLVPYKTIDGGGILKCFKLDNVIVNGKQIDCLVSKSNNINKDEVLLNNLLREKI